MLEPIVTPRLRLVPGTREILFAERDDPERFADLLGAACIEAWPPPLVDEAALTVVRRRLDEAPEQVGWWFWFALLQAGDELVGGIGFVGPPDRGTVELGYSFAAAHHNRGLCTEAGEALIAWAFGHREVERVWAQTYPDGHASQRVLAKLGFQPAGPGATADTIAFELPREAWLDRRAER